MKYKALLVTPDGDWVTDYWGCDTKHEVIEKLENQGSRWFFYPFQFVITDGAGRHYTKLTQRIVDASFPYEHLKGMTIAKALDYIKNDNR
jgi:hypothetical protein